MTTASRLSRVSAFDARAVPKPVRNAMRLLELEQPEVPTIDALAARVGLSAGHLSRQFAATFGESPAAYGRRIRLNHAATRLLFAPVPLSAIASSFGFESQPAFNRAFRRQHGAAPHSFVRQLRAIKPPAEELAPAPLVRVARRPTEAAMCRRFFGPDIATHWQRFLADLPANHPSTGRYAGLIHDSPAIVSAADQRYDCAIPVAAVSDLAASSFGSAGLDAIELPGGLHAEIEGCLAGDIGPAIRHLYSIWLPDKPTFLPEGDPMVHWWGEAASGFTVTIRLRLARDNPAWNMVPLDDQGAPLGRR